ncbi:hypothetical protein Taro_040328 [Colocasia esculenta]|uniref:Uncharacterized protein n=1 Tax=Colocasia esculenta TaxID=4460 RepID=A0A843WIE6_COLES|nr:hypothetical protein [Colocasia esculenta]
MVRGARSGSISGRRLSSGMGLSAALGSGEFTPPPPRVPASSPSSVPPPLVVGSGQCTPSPPTVTGASTVPEVKDAVSLQEGECSFYESTLRESNHRFTRRSDEARSRSVWTTPTRSNFKHLLYNARKNA